MKKTSAATVVSLILLAFLNYRFYAVLLFLFGWGSYFIGIDFTQIEKIIKAIFCITPLILLTAIILAIVGWTKSKTAVAKSVLGYSIALAVLFCLTVAACFGLFYFSLWAITPYEL